MFEIVNLVAFIACVILLAIKLESENHVIRHKLSLWKLHKSLNKEMEEENSLWEEFKAHSINDLYSASFISKDNLDIYIRTWLCKLNIGLEDVNISYEEGPSCTLAHITHK